MTASPTCARPWNSTRTTRRGSTASCASTTWCTATRPAHSRRPAWGTTPGLVWGPLLRAAAYRALGDGERGAEELAKLDPVALASAMDHDWFLSHTHLPSDVTDALADALAGLNPST